MVPLIEISKFEQLKASGDLPSPRGVALAIMRMTLQEEVSVHELGRVIRTDPAFTGRLVKAANGIIGYGRRPIVSVQDALTILGLPAVRNMALGFSLLTQYGKGVCEGFDYQHFWAQSLLRALGTQMLTLRNRVIAPDEAYSLGLLANVGELALATLYPHDYGKLRAEAGSDRVRIGELESRAYAMTNAELGAAMLVDWGIPRLFTDAVFGVAGGRTLAVPLDGSRQALLTRTLHLADQIGEVCLSRREEQPGHLQRMLLAGSHLSLDEEMLAALMDSVTGEAREWMHLLDMPAQAMPAFADLRRQMDEKEQDDAVLGPDQDELIAAAQSSDGARTGETPVASGVLQILLVSADVAERTQLRQIIDVEEFALLEAVDQDAALKVLLESSPSIMLMDYSVPGLVSADLLRAVRKTKVGRTVYVIAMLREISENAVVAMLEAGADDLLAKPVSPRLLLAKIRACRRLSLLRQEIESDREEMRHVAAELAVSNRRLHVAALTDPVTDIPNRRCLTDRLAQEWGGVWRDDRVLSCMIIDIDNFKQINDTYGHDTGDMLLRSVAIAMRGELRVHDLLARMGGDEFVVLCPEMGMEAALACAERLRKAVAGVRLPARLAHVRTSASIGVACREPTTADPASLLKRADKGLYLAKQAGRNRVMIGIAEDGQMTA